MAGKLIFLDGFWRPYWNNAD